MRKHLSSILILLLTLAACSTAGGIAEVTPIPTRDGNATLPALEVKATLPIVPTITPNATLMSISLTRAALPTPTPLSVRMAEGESLAVIRATDQAIEADITVELEGSPPYELSFNEFYEEFNPETGFILTEKLKSLDGKKVKINGYMAPPLALELDWFMLTLQPVGGCAFCGNSFDVLDGTALVYPVNNSVLFTGEGLEIIGTLEVGDVADPETGMVSLVRIYAEEVEIVEVDW